MLAKLLRRRNLARYSRVMGKFTPRVKPERRLSGIDQWAGMWIAVKDGQVIAAAPNSRDLVPMVRSKGALGEGAVAQFVPNRTDDIVVGVG